jgi:hypothetical protein
VADTNEEAVDIAPDIQGEGEAEAQVEIQLSPIEEKAMQEGWKPKELWEGDPDEWRDARTYLDRGELLKKISQSHKETKELRNAMKAMQDHNRKLAEAHEKELANKLKQEKIAALENQDHARVMEIDEALSESKDRAAALAAQASREALEAQQAAAHPEFVAWVDRNSWYANDAGMRGFADAIGTDYAKQNPHLPPSAVLKHVEDEVAKKFAVKADRPSKGERPVAVVTTSTRSASTTGSRTSDNAIISGMTQEERNIMNTLIKGGHITKEKYLADYRKISQRGVA